MLLSKKQLEFVQNMNHRWCFKGGATRSGKTYLDYRWVIPLRIRERIGKDGLTVILGVTKSTIERNVLAPMRQLFGRELVGNISSDNTVRLFGERCYALGAEKVSQVSKLRGSSIKYVYGDEVADWSEEVFSLLKSRLDQPYSCFDGTFNPSYPGHWLKKFLDSDADIFSQTYTIDDNPFLDAGVARALKSEYAGTVYYDRYILGLWKSPEGLVYPMFDRARHVVTEEPAGGRYYVSVDYGTLNPTVFGLWHMTPGQAVMVKEYYWDGRAEFRQKTDEEYCDDLIAFVKGYKIERVIVDPSAASFKEAVRRRGFSLRDADNAVLDGIRLCGTLLAAGRIRFMPGCEHTFAEFQNYLWDEKSGTDKVIKEHDHSMDQMRYLAYTLRYLYFAPQVEKLKRPQSDFPQLLGSLPEEGYGELVIV